MTFPEIDLLNSYVSRIFRVEDVTMGNPKEWLVRYRGQLISEDTVSAYDQLSEAVRPYNLTPLFRKERDGKQVIFLVPSPASPRPFARPYVNVILFILTIFSVMLTGADSNAAQGGGFMGMLRHIFTGWPFALSMMGILFAHEMGHYVACRIYKVPATLPFFIPAPLISPLGTFGAFITMRGIPKNKRILFDVGVAGPLAGLVVALPFLAIGLALSHLGPIEPAPTGMFGILEGNSLVYLLAKYLAFGKLLPEPISMGGLPPAVYWLRYFFTGQPLPLHGLDVQLHSFAFAGWAGLLVTALNLVPVGTLDGGHVAYGLFGEKARRIFPLAMGALIALILLPALLTLSFAALNFSWLLWVFLLFWLGNVRTIPLDDITSLDGRRRALGFFVLLLFFVLFTPIPFVTY